MAFVPAEESTSPPVAADPPAELPRVGTGYIWLLVIAQFGVYLAYVTPIGISLSIKVVQLAPAHQEYLGYITGVASIVSLLTATLIGRLSDRTRGRFGRRRPFLVGGMIVGLLGLIVVANAAGVVALGVGWALTALGWATVLGALLNSQADRLPEAQRGRVSGLVGAFSQLAPVVGVLVVGQLAASNLLLFLVPGVAGVAGVLIFVCLVREPDSRELAAAAPLTFGSLARSYVFNPRRYPDFAWNWLGKFLFMFGLTFNTTFVAFFLADRMHETVPKVASTVAVLAGGGIVAAILGAIGGGFLSDRLRRRRIFAFLGGIVFAAGAVIMALSPSVPVIALGAVVGNLGLGLFSAVDQALALDVLPERDTDAGRYNGIYSYATTIAQGLAPLIAPVFLAIGVSGAAKNYTLLYLIAALITLTGGLTVLLRVKSVR